MAGKKLIMDEMKKQLELALPLIIANGLQIILQLISLMFLGHLGELALSGASLATSFAVVTGFSLTMGMSSSLETLCGQAFGAHQYKMLGIYTQRAIFILTLICVPISMIWAFSDKILLLLHQDEQISAVAGIYARWMIPSLFAYAPLQCVMRFLQAQNNVLPLMISSSITALLHLLFCWLLVTKSGYGIRGAAFSLSMSYWVNLLLLVVYVKLSDRCKTTWPTGFSKEATKDVARFLKLAIPSAAMICLELWAFEVILFLSGILPNPEVKTSVMSISINTSALVYTIIVALGSNVSIRVSNELGAGNANAARLVILVSMFMTFSEGVIIGLVMVTMRSVWGNAYSNNTEIANQVASMMPLLAFSHLVNGAQCVFQGIARGCGWQKSGAFINLGSFYAAGIPCSIILAFVFNLGIKGLWTGIIVALLLQDVLFATLTICTDWEEEVSKASDKVPLLV